MLNSLAEEQFKQLARYLSYPRGVKIHDRENYNTMLRGRRVNMLMREVGKNNLDLLSRPDGSNIFKDQMDLKDVKDWYATNLKGNAGRYLKTSSLIITYADLLTTGGHNLSSRISRVNSMTNYKHNRGNYAPTNYEHTPSHSPDLKENPDDKPTGSKPATSKPAKKSTGKAKTTHTAKPSNNQSDGHSHNRSVRPRNEVISSSPRRTRGL
jgi:hypothetical protein